MVATLRNIVGGLMVAGSLLSGSCGKGYVAENAATEITREENAYNEASNYPNANDIKKMENSPGVITDNYPVADNSMVERGIAKKKNKEMPANVSVYTKDSGEGNLEIYSRMFYPDINSGIVKRLTVSPGKEILPLLSPDKTKVLYYYEVKDTLANGQWNYLYILKVIDMDGKEIMTMKNTCFYPLADLAKWSEDSRKITYTIRVPQKGFFVTCEADIETGEIKEKKRFGAYERDILTGELKEE